MKRVFWIFVLVVIFGAILFHLAGGFALQKLTEQAVNDFNSRNNDAQVELGDARFSPLLGAARFQKIAFEDEKNLRSFSASELRFSVGLFNILRASFSGIDGLLGNSIDLGLQGNGIAYLDQETNQNITIESLAANFSGSVSDIQQGLYGSDLSLRFDISGISLSERISALITQRADFLPEITNVSNLSGNIQTNQNPGSIEISRFQLDAVDTDLFLRGNAKIADDGSSIRLQNADLPFRLRTVVKPGFTYKISDEIGEISFQHITLESKIIADNFDIEIPEGEGYLRLKEFTFSPSDMLKAQIAAYRGFIPFSIETIESDNLNLSWFAEEQKFDLEELSLEFPAFKMSVSGNLPAENRVPDTSADLEKGMLRITQANQETQNIIRNLEMLFELSLQREDDVILIPLKGSLRQPRPILGNN